MQLRLEFLEEKDGRRAKQLPRWERLANRPVWRRQSGLPT